MDTLQPFHALCCPLDQQPLLANEQGWSCPQGHQFDRAKQGYVHLLPVQRKRSRDPGDSKDMVQARKRFLEAGYYQPVASTLAQLVHQHLKQAEQDQPAYLDAGCGEGYYLQQFIEHTQNQGTREAGEASCTLLGLDISKWAMQVAARRSRQVQWVVASNAALPAPANSFDVISSVFGFPMYEEFARVLKPHGLLLVIEPGPEHLHELRQIIYPELTEQEAQKEPNRGPFTVASTTPIRFQCLVQSTEHILDLLAMTPHVHRITPEAHARLSGLSELQITVDMRCQLLTLTE
ncbi:rRNA (guanine-N1)-methyltransferase [Aliidiomarina taiwanensis]|uniref:rRNA (Guanine-N1)-methyltransferase n=1 Tax=Aliidiomarina taiwanensis TaxID=946228 RepID=A0A432X8B8_9GAMM|nr:methyltransferase domain-containing protein [Aliidiomarina taiwanensis]RUO43632.1 rRNA (guanine-N1)-methyltransferase [Aliidiomarina taiwanensis]